MPPPVGSSPREVLDALPADDRARFRGDMAAATQDAAGTLDFSRVNEVVEQARRYALVAGTPGHDRAVEIAEMVRDGREDEVDVQPVDLDDLH